MAKTKYREYVQRMLELHKAEFDAFQPIHDAYQQSPKEWATQFHAEGKKIMEIVKRFESQLCSQMESGAYGKWSSKVADKFMEEVRHFLPLVDRIGLKSSWDGTLEL
jgi:hypothetical protein